jgi:hypothetical protein
LSCSSKVSRYSAFVSTRAAGKRWSVDCADFLTWSTLVPSAASARRITGSRAADRLLNRWFVTTIPETSSGSR